ncbi:uncharacterized protein RHOBADRAFT_38149 [Rhodotorula graminis WP1]|uniref:Smr domain-containing protein n=1 Tax=Rhodotorula graminis (strain WP1) TaxID=578459 RepID=A0A0P9GK41_RHOGW|nr:uncharacterized protein RHOBADRAFT_38149 [Rhodotorula graminis WP1]KPV73577.1 hypothetical protein RHOBADRAFT_38149 [Rhodotorula graminis WP1]
MAVTANQVIYYLKKAFKFYQRWQKKHKQSQGQQQQQHGYPQQGQSPYPAQAPHQQPYQSSPYPQAGHAPQQHHQQGGYGAHDGRPTNTDMANAQNSQYVELRNLAIREGDLMAKAFSASKQAYTAGDGASAHDLSVQGKEHQRNKDRYNDQAAAWIFNENNKVQPPGSIDLHGLYVQEAIEYTERAIADGRNKGMPELRIIVGKGNHSPSHVAKIKPAITDLMQREHLTATLDPHNGGVLVVQLQGQGGGKGSGQFLRELEGSKDNDCVVM